MDEIYRKALVAWHPELDNPDLRGWCVVAAYVVAAAFCARAALAVREMGPERKADCSIWRLLAAGLLVLGINKQLNLQTLLIVLGRRAAFAGGWYEQRRLAQVVFTLVFALAGLAALWLLRSRFRRFFAVNRMALAGMLVLLAFVLIRAASINHVLQRAGFPPGADHGDKRWTWVLEIGGSACLALAANKAARQGSPTRQPESNMGFGRP